MEYNNLIMDDFIAGNEGNIIGMRRLGNIPDMNEAYSNACEGFNEFTNPFPANTSENNAWNLGYSKSELPASLEAFRSAYKRGKIARAFNITTDTAPKIADVTNKGIDIFKRIKDLTNKDTPQVNDGSNTTFEANMGDGKPDNKNLIIGLSVVGGVLLIVGVAYAIKKSKKGKN